MPLVSVNKQSSAAKQEKIMLEIWQIDSFEGGKGSRASYLQKAGNTFSDDTYVQVLSLTQDAVKRNLQNGTCPDLISYGAGICGLESYISGKPEIWCRGGYCFLALDGADFSDISAQNTVINGGTENLTEAAALFTGVCGADILKNTGAYVSLINGKYKYLLGTQRDIARLKTRNVAFGILPVTEFNDLYQNISVTAAAKGKKADKAQKFIEYLIKNGENIKNLGLFCDGYKLYDDETNKMEGIDFAYTLKYPMSSEAKNSVTGAIKNKDLNLLKSLLK